jgi:hypothetical protein
LRKPLPRSRRPVVHRRRRTWRRSRTEPRSTRWNAASATPSDPVFALRNCRSVARKKFRHARTPRPKTPSTRAYCYRRRQGPKCEQRSTFLDVYEAQILDYLESFSLPGNLQEVLRDVQERSREGVADVAVQRQRIETQLANVRTMFELGDLSREEYVQRREQLRSRKESLRESDEWEGILAQAAAFLTDLPAAWRAANDAQRNALARMLYVQVRIKDDRVAAVEPQPSFAPFFSWDCQVRRLSGGSDGDRSVGCILPVGSLVIAVRPHCTSRPDRSEPPTGRPGSGSSRLSR